MKSNGSMNRIYRLIWNATLRTWVVAAETARGRGKQSGTALTAAALSVAGAAMLMSAGAARAGPQGAQLVSGSAQISQTGAAGQTTTTVQQASANLALNWQSFNVGAAERVDFVQPSAAAIAVNRIADTQGSVILGRLSSNGQVWLINPNGLLFGRDAQVNVGGLVASTLDLVDAAGNANSRRFIGQGSASVVNLGTIAAAEGGSVALLGHQVVNQGLISARLGTVAMAAGNAVTLSFSNNRLLGLQVDGNALNALADNGGVLRADGGQVLMSAGARDSLLSSVVNNSGVVEARTVAQHEGRIMLLAGKTAGSLTLTGTLDASAPESGNGGFIETSAAQVQIADSARLTTLSASGQTGRWLVDPTDFNVGGANSDISGATLSAALALNNVELSSEAGLQRPVEGLGDININDAVSWSTNRNLTLTASNSVNVNASITATGNGPFTGVWINTGTGSFNLAEGAAINLPNVSVASQNALVINGTAYRVINKLGATSDTAPLATSLQGMKNDAEDGNGGAYALGSDIDATATSTWNAGAGFTPIGDYATDLPFSGIFNGLGHKISNLTINRPTTDYVGLFGYAVGAEISNLRLVGASVRGQDFVGALAGYVDNVVDRSHAAGTVRGGDYVGGLVGWSDGVISRSSSSASVSGANYVGGLVGYNSLDSVSNSRSSGSVTGSGDYVGGLVGQNDASVVDSQSNATVSGASEVGGLVGYNLGSISGSQAGSTVSGTVSGASWVGGLVGHNADTGTIETSQASGAVSASADSAGGLVGNNEGAISSSQASGPVSGPTATGGLVGVNGFSGTIAESQASGAVSGVDSVGGLVGDNQNLITNSAASGAVSGTSVVGGLVGNNAGGITGSRASGTVTASGDGAGAAYAGGLVGSNDGNIAASRASGAVNGVGDWVGGLVGDNSGSGTVSTSFASSDVAGSGSVGGLAGANRGSIRTSFASGKVTGSGDWVGGLVGDNPGLVSDSYASGSVSGGDGVGGLVGYNGGAIATSLATGPVSATGLAGGLVGSHDNALLATVVNSFWNAETSVVGIGQGDVASATGLSAAQIKQQSNFTGWDFSNATGAWIQYDGQTAPLLRSFMTPLTVVMNYGATPGKVYDASTGFIGGSASFLVDGLAATPDPTQLLGSLSSHLASAQVGSRVVTPGGYFSTGQFGYLVSYTGSTAVAVTPAALSIAAVADSKVYDGTTLSALAPLVSGLQGSDTVGAATQVFASRNVLGSGASALAVAAYTVNDGNGGANYSVSTPGAAGTITPKALSIAAVSDSKVYDATTGSSGTPVAGGLVGGDSVIGASQAFMSKNVLGSNASTLAVAAYTVADGNGGANYTVGTATASGSISPAPLTVFAVTDSKVYDGSTASSAVPGVSGLLAGDSLSPNGQVFSSKNVLGSGASTLMASAGAANDGNGGANYQVSSTTASGSITPAPLTVAATGLAKVYDASSTASVTLAGNSFGSDQLSYSLSAANFADRHVGNAKPVSVTGIAVAGPDAGNYSLQNTSATTSARISPAPLVIVAVSDSKVYDATTGSTGAPVVSGLLGADSVVGASQAFLSKNVLGSNASALAVAAYTVADGNGGANYAVSTATAAGTITPAPLTVFAVTDSKVYDGSTASSAVPGVSGLLGSDTLSTTGQVFSSKNVLGSNASTLAVTAYSVADGNGGANYAVSTPTATGSISAAPLNIAAVSDSKVYDATTGSTGAPVASGLLGSDSLASANQAFASRNVLGSNVSTLAVTAYDVADGNAGANYAVSTATASGSITPAPLNVFAVTDSKVYDASTASAATPGTSGLLGSDSISGLRQVFASKNVLGSSASTLAVSAYAVADGHGGANYAVSTPTATGTITPAPLTIAAVSDSKVYDATTGSTGMPVASGLLGADSLASASQAFASRNVLGSNASTLAVAAYSVADGNAGANYAVSTATAAGSITPAPLSVFAVTDSKVYDASTASAATPGTSGLLGGDSVSGLRQVFASKNVLGSSASTLTVSAYAVSDGHGGANYAVDDRSTAVGSISAAPLTFGGISAVGKTYDGNATATLSGSALVTALGADQLNVTGSGSGVFADKRVGSDKAVTISGYGLAGADAGNYALGQPLGVTASIGPAALSATGLSAADKVYDGSTRASLNGQAVVNPLAGDLVNLAGTAQGSFADRNVGTGKPVSVSGLGLTGADAGNYRLSPVSAAAAAITPAPLVYLATPTSLPVGQTPTNLTGTMQGFAAGDTLANATTGQALWSTPATAASPVGRYAIDGSGLQATNYSLSQADGNAEALNLQIGSLPPVVSNQLALQADLIQPQPDRRSVQVPAPAPTARRQTPLQVVDGGVRLPGGAFNTTP